MFEFLLDVGNYEDRKVGRNEVYGLHVSTAFTSDEGYETAIIDSNSVYPVERYKTKKEAEIGHKKWMEKAKTIKVITMLSGMGGFVPEERIILERNFDVQKHEIKLLK